MRSLTAAVFTAFATLVAAPSPSFAQATVPIKTLGKPDAELTESFTGISSVRELSDGRVLVVDNMEKTLQLADFRTQALSRVGRDGAGPLEYGSVGRLYALSADVTWMHDFTNNRWFVIQGDGKPSGTQPYQDPYKESVGLAGVDAMGRLYFAVRPPGSREEGGVQAIARYDAKSGKVDTITSISLPVGKQSGAQMLGGGLIKSFTNMPYAAEDVAVVAPDGRVAVVRVSDYHVEWFDGSKRVAGSAVKFEPVRIDAAEKRAYLERQIRPGSFTVRNPGGTGAAAPRDAKTLPKVANTPDALDDTGMKWPAAKPPFSSGAASIDGSGRLWVRRTARHDDKSPRYDVFDSTGKLAMQVVLPVGTTLVGFGRASVYLSRVDDDDLRYLQRYRAP